MTKTQIYLEPEQHSALSEEARKRRVSLAALIRELVDEHLHGLAPPAERRKELLKIIGLGSSGRKDMSVRHDEELGKILYDEHKRNSG